MLTGRVVLAGACKRVLRTPQSVRGFHASAAAFVKVGDAIPDVQLVEDSPGNKVSIARELKGRGLIVGVPAAFSPSCSGKVGDMNNPARYPFPWGSPHNTRNCQDFTAASMRWSSMDDEH